MSDFFVFEGINGCGKTSAMEGVAAKLRKKHGAEKVLTLRNPSGGPIGNELRQFSVAARMKGFPQFFSNSEETMTFARRLALLFIADRQMMQRHIDEALNAGRIVLCDRYTLSTLVYQCAMVGDIHLESPFADWIRAGHQGILPPAKTFVFDVPLDVARARLALRGEKVDDLMMATIEPAARAMYLKASDGEYFFHKIDGNRPIEEVVTEVVRHIEEPLF